MCADEDAFSFVRRVGWWNCRFRFNKENQPFHQQMLRPRKSLGHNSASSSLGRFPLTAAHSAGNQPMLRLIAMARSHRNSASTSRIVTITGIAGLSLTASLSISQQQSCHQHSRFLLGSSRVCVHYMGMVPPPCPHPLVCHLIFTFLIAF